MGTKESNILAGISLLGGVAHVMLFMNGYWNDIFWMTSIMIVIIPLVIRKTVKGKKISLAIFGKNSKKKTKKQTLHPSLRGNCKNCGNLLEDRMLSYCSQSCGFEHYLSTQSKDSLTQDKFHVSA